MVLIHALGGTQVGSQTIEVLPGPAVDPLDVYLGTRSAVADTEHYSMVVTVPKDAFGNPVADDTAVDYHITRPSLAQSSAEGRTKGLLSFLRIWTGTVSGRTRVGASIGDAHGPERPFLEVADRPEPYLQLGVGSLGTGDGTLDGQPGNALDNSDTAYETDLTPGLSNALEIDLNANVVRVQSDPQARHTDGLSNVPAVAGDPSVPVLTMHNLGDLFVPFHLETIYGERVEANRKSDLVVQRAIRGVNHCGFTTGEYETGFADLVNWVENDVRPIGDDVTDPGAVAQPDFGCAFTEATFLHLFATPCP